jgi:hypothetical protein
MRIQEAPRLSMKNKASIASSKKAGCYHCLNIFDAVEIKTYTDKNQTAICPKCGIDSILGDADIKISAQLLKEIKSYWFGN